MIRTLSVLFFFFNDTATTEIYTLSLHDALPILEIIFLTWRCWSSTPMPKSSTPALLLTMVRSFVSNNRSEEHTSELQSLRHLVCRLLLEKKKKRTTNRPATTVR